MDSTHFTKPVTVLVGLGFPRKIRSAYEAYQLLCDMRLATSRGAHRIAMQACKAAIEVKSMQRLPDLHLLPSPAEPQCDRSELRTHDGRCSPGATGNGVRPNGTEFRGGADYRPARSPVLVRDLR